MSQHVWSIANQRSSYGALVSRVLIWGQPHKYKVSAWLILGIQCLAPSSQPKSQTNTGCPRTSGKQKQSLLGRTERKCLKTREYINSLIKQDFQRIRGYLPRTDQGLILLKSGLPLEWAGFEQQVPDKLILYCTTSNLKFVRDRCHKAKQNRMEIQCLHFLSQLPILFFLFFSYPKPPTFKSRQPFFLVLVWLSEIMIAFFSYNL